MSDYYDNNIYRHPEKYDCEILMDLDEGASYEWEHFVVFRDKVTGILGYFEGASCSCNGIEDDLGGREDITWVHDLAAISAAAFDWARPNSWYSGRGPERFGRAAEKVRDLRHKVKVNGNVYQRSGT